MANTLSATMTDILASPVVSQPAGLWHGRLRVKFSGQIAVAAADSDGHIYPAVRLRAHDRVLCCLHLNGAITAGTDYDLGVYEAGDWSVADQTVVDVNALGDAVDMSSIRATPTIIDNLRADHLWHVQLWEAAGVAADPGAGTEYDICWTGVTVGTATENMATAVVYTSGD